MVLVGDLTYGHQPNALVPLTNGVDVVVIVRMLEEAAEEIGRALGRDGVRSVTDRPLGMSQKEICAHLLERLPERAVAGCRGWLGQPRHVERLDRRVEQVVMLQDLRAVAEPRHESLRHLVES